MLSLHLSSQPAFHFAEPERNQGQTEGEKNMREPGSSINPPTPTPCGKGKLTIEARAIGIICGAVLSDPCSSS